MSNILRYLVALQTIQLVAAQVSPAAPEFSNGALELTVEHAKPERGLTEGQDLYGILTVRLRNVSTESLTIQHGSPLCDLAIEIRDSMGKSPKLTELGEKLPKTATERADCLGLSNQTVELRPGKEISFRWNINPLFVLERGHPYAIKVTWAKGLPTSSPSGRRLRSQLSQSLAIK